jgi:hypothetical protein
MFLLPKACNGYADEPTYQKTYSACRGAQIVGLLPVALMANNGKIAALI